MKSSRQKLRLEEIKPDLQLNPTETIRSRFAVPAPFRSGQFVLSFTENRRSLTHQPCYPDSRRAQRWLRSL